MEYGLNPEPLNDMVYTLLASLDDLIAGSDEHTLKVKYALDKVLLYRLAGHYALALDALQNTEANQHSNYSYWDCILNLEWAYFQGQIEASQFAADAENCMGYFQARRQRRQPVPMSPIQRKPSAALIAMPNPTVHSSVFRFPACDSPSSLHIMDAQGRLVQSERVSPASIEIAVDASHLPIGLYFVALHQPNRPTLRMKWVVSR